MPDRTTAIAIFDDRIQAQRAIEQLKRAGFTDKEIGVTARDAGQAGATSLPTDNKETHAKEGAIAGVTADAGVGTSWGLGILAGVLPAIRPAITGGTLAAILASAAAGAATAGLAGTLIGLGIPEDEASYYDREFRAGRVLVTVRADGRLSEVQAILRSNGGRDMRGDVERTAAPRTARAVATEEVSVGKRAAADDERFDTTIRKEEITIDKRGRRDAPPGPR